MCGRYSLDTHREDLSKHFGVHVGIGQPSFEFPPRFNIAPTQTCIVMRKGDEGPQWAELRWGLKPSWADSKGPGFLLARSETVATKPSFRSAFKKRRCLIPATGFFEWQDQGKGKKRQPWHAKTGELFAMAGIWERGSFALITMGANSTLSPIHDRMPVVLSPEAYDVWLDPASERPLLEELMAGAILPPEAWGTYPVGFYVNKAGNEGARCLDPKDEQAQDDADKKNAPTPKPAQGHLF